MATKFRVKGTSDVYGLVTVDIGLDGYVGAIAEFDGVGRDWISLKIGKGSKDISTPILLSEIELVFYALDDFAAIELGKAEAYQYSITILDDNSDTLWAGWVDPERYSEAYVNTPYVCKVTGSDGLESLKTIPFNPSSTKKPILDFIIDILDLTGIDLPIFEAVNLYSNGMLSGVDDSPLTQAEISGNTFLQLGENPNAYQALEVILRPFFSRIYQYRGWNIENIQLKRASYYQRYYLSDGTFVSSALIDPLKELDSQSANFRGFVNKSGVLGFNPALKNAEVYINTVELTGDTTTGGFQNGSDWVSASELVAWSAFGGVAPEQVAAGFNDFEFAVRIPDTGNAVADYLESDAYPVTALDLDGRNQSINIQFYYKMDYPSIRIFGTKPTLYFQVILEPTSGLPPTYSWDGSNWIIGSTKKFSIIPNKKNRWREFRVNIGTIDRKSVV